MSEKDQETTNRIFPCRGEFRKRQGEGGKTRLPFCRTFDKGYLVEFHNRFTTFHNPTGLVRAPCKDTAWNKDHSLVEVSKNATFAELP